MSVEQKQQAMEAAAAQAQVDEDDEGDDTHLVGGHKYLLFTAMPSWLVSMVIHAVGLLILAILTVPDPMQRVANIITAALPLENVEEIEEFEEDLLRPLDVDVSTDFLADAAPMEMISSMVPEHVTEVALSADVDAAAISVDLVDFGAETAPRSDLYKEIGSFSGSGLEGRGAGARKALVVKYGGNEQSEAAVAAALRWIAAIQMDDGGWSFDHRLGSPRPERLSENPGSLATARNGATAMALLPFLGAGQTHVEGSYRKQVQGGLAYLINNMKRDGGLNENGGTMYSHGLAAITLTEAYGMTKDRALMAPAQGALNFIAASQDPIGGGWRYQPRQPGDTSVLGWMVMAMKSGHMSYLQVHPNTIRGTTKFLDSVQLNNGAFYGYLSPGRGHATSAIGLLCRMHLGWEQDHQALMEGVRYLAETGPSKTDMYYNFYATQVMRHIGEPYWDAWNREMRDYLINTQVKDGPAKGSWYFQDTFKNKSRVGGRLYNTSLATMILEVYYRHMPIYGKQATTEEFPL